MMGLLRNPGVFRYYGWFRLRLLLLAAFIFAGGAPTVWSAVEWAVFPDGAGIRARSTKKDIIYVYTSARAGKAADEWFRWLESSRFDASGLGDRFVFCKVELPEGKINLSSPVTMEAVNMASRHGIRMLPTMILCDNRDRVYASKVGGVHSDSEAGRLADSLLELQKFKLSRDELLARAYAEQELSASSDLVLKALEQVPSESWPSSYAACMNLLKRSSCRDERYLVALREENRIRNEEELAALIRKLPSFPKGSELETALKSFQDFLDEKELNIPTRQCVLLGYVYPLLVNRSKELFQKTGTNSPELEETFNDSVHVLEEVRDLDPQSYWGRMAHEIREELRKARLAAARYD